ncbi:MAG TPA: hypothetical protein VMR52_10880 [Dehalococcoidia bacterium]|nr:hypothetical protein [Dehalococcoidia bacterium]
MELGYIDTPEEWRDLFIMMFMVAGTILFLLGIIFTIITGFMGMGLFSRVRKILRDNVQPAAANVRETTETVKGTVSFVSDNAVKPVVKVYGVAAGAKRFVGVAANLAGRGKKGK